MPSSTGQQPLDAPAPASCRTLGELLRGVTYIHASMPCEAFTPLARRQPKDRS